MTNKSHKTGDGHATRVAKSRSGDYESDDGWSDFEDEEEDYGCTEVDKDNLSILRNVASNQEYFTFGDLWQGTISTREGHYQNLLLIMGEMGIVYSRYILCLNNLIYIFVSPVYFKTVALITMAIITN